MLGELKSCVVSCISALRRKPGVGRAADKHAVFGMARSKELYLTVLDAPGVFSAASDKSGTLSVVPILDACCIIGGPTAAVSWLPLSFFWPCT